MNYLNQVELPVLSGSLERIRQITRSETSRVQDLAEVILRDADLTSQVLKVANTVLYNPSSQVISTVSRAISLIGFDTVRSIAMTSMLLDALLQNTPRKPLLESLAYALHSGVQARQMLSPENPGRREEIFIAAMLSEIGELAFWSCRTPQSEQLQAHSKAKQAPGYEKPILGTTFRTLSARLVETWHLGELLQDVLSNRPPALPLSLNIRTLCELVKASHAGNPLEEEQILKRLSAQLGKAPEDLQSQFRESCHQAAEMFSQYGLRMLLPYLPADDPARRGEVSARVDANLQLQILQDLSAMMLSGANLNEVLQTVAEGIHRGASFQRVALLMQERGSDWFTPRIVLGPADAQWRRNLQLHAPTAQRYRPQDLPQGIFNGTWGTPVARALFGSAAHQSIEGEDFFLAPLTIGNRLVGALFADMGPAGLLASPAQQQAFAHFSQQARFALLQLTLR